MDAGSWWLGDIANLETLATEINPPEKRVWVEGPPLWILNFLEPAPLHLLGITFNLSRFLILL